MTIVEREREKAGGLAASKCPKVYLDSFFVFSQIDHGGRKKKTTRREHDFRDLASARQLPLTPPLLPLKAFLRVGFWEIGHPWLPDLSRHCLVCDNI